MKHVATQFELPAMEEVFNLYGEAETEEQGIAPG